MKKITITLAMLLVTLVTFSQKKKELKDVSIDEIVEETQMSSNSDDIQLVWWLPKEFWQVSFSQDPSTSQADIDEMTELMKDYTVILAVNGKVGMFGGVTYKEYQEIKDNTKVYYNGEMLKQLDPKDTPADLQNFFGMIKPIMKNMLGQMGENMQLLIFKNGKKVDVDPYKEGTLSFEFFGYNDEISLPLGSLLEKKRCPKCDKKYNGKWSYCPFTGSKLEE